MRAVLDVSAQFGGRDAAQAVLPHFKALRAASGGGGIRAFPVRKLAFVLRVDGDISKYGLSGAGNVDVDVGGKYISIDIGCTLDDRSNLEERIATAVADAPAVLQSSGNALAREIDFAGLTEDLAAFLERYQASLPK